MHTFDTFALKMIRLFLTSDIHIFNKMAATRRLQKELQDMRNSPNKAFRDVQVIHEIPRGSVLTDLGLAGG